MKRPPVIEVVVYLSMPVSSLVLVNGN